MCTSNMHVMLLPITWYTSSLVYLVTLYVISFLSCTRLNTNINLFNILAISLYILILTSISLKCVSLNLFVSFVIKIEYTTLGDITVKTEIHYDPDASTTVIEEDKEFVDEYLLLEGAYVRTFCSYILLIDFLLHHIR